MKTIVRAFLLFLLSFELCSGVEQDSYLEGIKEELLKRWPKNRTVNVICHGHSVPTGYFLAGRVDTFNSYPHLLHRSLNEHFPYAVVNVITTGIGGESSDQGVERFETEVLNHRPDVITIDYGLNDRRIGLEKAKESWSVVIERALAEGIKVILLTPTNDTNADLSDPQDPLNLHAEQIRQLAKEYDVALVDSLALFKKAIDNGAEPNSLMSQNNHPNRKGHELVAAELAKWFVPTKE